MVTLSFESVAREWHELNKGRWTDVHQADVLRSLERDVFPTLGKRHHVKPHSPRKP